MIRMITDRPSEWKDWMIQAMGEIEEDVGEVDCIGIVILPKDMRNKDISTAYYNSSINDMILMKEHMAMDAIDGYIRANIEKYLPVDAEYTPDDIDMSDETDGRFDYSENES